MYLNKRKLQTKLVLQKNKKKLGFFNFSKYLFLIKNKKKKLNFIFLKNTFYLELKFIKFVIKKLRKLVKKKKFKAYVYICANHAWFKKNKNSRMGRGKGEFSRYVFLNKNLKPIFIFFKISSLRILKFCKFSNMQIKKFFFFKSF